MSSTVPIDAKTNPSPWLTIVTKPNHSKLSSRGSLTIHSFYTARKSLLLFFPPKLLLLLWKQLEKGLITEWLTLNRFASIISASKKHFIYDFQQSTHRKRIKTETKAMVVASDFGGRILLAALADLNYMMNCTRMI